MYKYLLFLFLVSSVSVYSQISPYYKNLGEDLDTIIYDTLRYENNKNKTVIAKRYTADGLEGIYEKFYNRAEKDTLQIVHSFLDEKIITDIHKNEYDTIGNIVKNSHERMEENIVEIEIRTSGKNFIYQNNKLIKEISGSNTVMFNKETKNTAKIDKSETYVLYEYENDKKTKVIKDITKSEYDDITNTYHNSSFQKDITVFTDTSSILISKLDRDADGTDDLIKNLTKYYKDDNLIKFITEIDDGKKKTKTLSEYTYQDNKMNSLIETNYFEGDLKTITNIVTTKFKYGEDGYRYEDETIVKFPPFDD